MMRNCADINWLYLGDAIPAFLTIIIIPMTYNIAYGLITGILTMIILKVIPSYVYKVSCRPSVRSSPKANDSLRNIVVWREDRTPQLRGRRRLGHPSRRTHPHLDASRCAPRTILAERRGRRRS